MDLSNDCRYGVSYAHTAEARDALIAAVPQAHKDFLQRLLWVYDAPVGFAPVGSSVFTQGCSLPVPKTMNFVLKTMHFVCWLDYKVIYEMTQS